MVSPRVFKLLQHELEQLPEPLQERVLKFARDLATSQPKGMPIEMIRQFAGRIPSEDLREMRDIIERDCGQVDPREW